MPGRTLPAESRPSISIRTSCSLLQRMSDDSEENNEEKERPMAGASKECGAGRRKGEETSWRRREAYLHARTRASASDRL